MPPVVSPDAAPAPEWADQAEVQEAPIFAAPDGRRGRRMRAIALVAAGVLSLWLIALVAGMLGFGRLPTIPDLGTGAGGDAPKTSRPVAKPPPAAGPSTAASSSSATTPGGGSNGTSSGGGTAGTGRSGSAPSGTSPQTASPRPSPKASQPAASNPVASAPTTTSRPGRRVGQTTDTTSTTTAPTLPGPAPSAIEHRQSDEHAGSKKS